MRSLVLLDAHLHELVERSGPTTVSTLTADPATNSLYAIAQEPRPDGTATLSLYHLAPSGARGVSSARAAVCVLPRCSPPARLQLPPPIATWATESASSFAKTDSSVVVALKYLQENDSLCFVLANGDIEQLFDPSNEAGLEQRVRLGC